MQITHRGPTREAPVGMSILGEPAIKYLVLRGADRIKEPHREPHRSILHEFYRQAEDRNLLQYDRAVFFSVDVAVALRWAVSAVHVKYSVELIEPPYTERQVRYAFYLSDRLHELHEALRSAYDEAYAFYRFHGWKFED